MFMLVRVSRASYPQDTVRSSDLEIAIIRIMTQSRPLILSPNAFNRRELRASNFYRAEDSSCFMRGAKSLKLNRAVSCQEQCH